MEPNNQNSLERKNFFTGLSLQNNYSKELQAALGFMVLQFLFKITFELEGAQRITNLPVIKVVFFVLPMLVFMIIFSLLRQRSAYILGIIFSGFNIIAALFLILTNNLPNGYSALRPLNVITTCFFIAYFCYLEYRNEKAKDKNSNSPTAVLVSLFLVISWLCLMSVSLFTHIGRGINMQVPSINIISSSSIQIFVIASIIISISIISFIFLKKDWIFPLAGTFGLLQFMYMTIILIVYHAPIMGLLLGIPLVLSFVLFSFLHYRKNQNASIVHRV
jgi:hypothetical protein